MLANPALFEVAPGATQIARLGLRTEPGTAEKSYRVILDEVPTDRPRRPGEVRTLLRISIPIFVSAPDTAARLNWRVWPQGPGRAGFAIQNQGTAHVQINRLALARRDGTRLGAQDMSVYLLPGATRQVTLDTSAPLRTGEALKLEAATDQADVSLDLVAGAAGHEAGHP